MVMGILLVAVVYFIAQKEAQIHGTSAKEEFAGICTIALDRTVKKRSNMEKVMALFAKNPQLSNHEIRKALGVSSRTTVRYMDDLQKEGRVKQIGRAGHGVTYLLLN